MNKERHAVHGAPYIRKRWFYVLLTATLPILARNALLVVMSTPHTALYIRRRWLDALLAAALLTLVPSAVLAAAPAQEIHAHSVEVTDADEWPQVALQQMPGELVRPVHLTSAGDGSNRLFVVEKSGVIRILQDGVLLADPFLDIGDRVNSSCNECGLLSVAFPPGYSQGGYFFVAYTATENLAPPEPSDKENESGNDTVIARFRIGRDANHADPASEEMVLVRNQPFANHNGGLILFGPDGYLYFGAGDGGSGGDPLNSGQSTDTLLGKMLRIEVGATSAYSVPADNPFVGLAETHRPEIWAQGLRNPWRFSFDRSTGDLYIADVGQNQYEEINWQPASSSGGENYGWNVMEGAHCYNTDSCDQTGLTLPVHEYSHDPAERCSSVTGGAVYRGPITQWQGVYFFADYCSGRISALRRDGAKWTSSELLDTDISIASFGEDESGSLYIVGNEANEDGQSAGVVYKLIDSTEAPAYALYLSLLYGAPQ